MTYDIVLFDIDGTLCDPGKSMIECARYALSKFNIHETDEEKLRRLIGPPLEHAFRDYYGFNKVQADRAVSYFREMMQNEGVQLYEAYPGIVEILEELKASGKRLAVVTSKIDHIARETLKKTGLIDYFETISAQQPKIVVDKEVILAKALSELNVLNVSSVVMVGDRKHDIEAANTHKIDSIGVLWGYSDRDELQAENATYIVDTIDVLRRVLLD